MASFHAISVNPEVLKAIKMKGKVVNFIKFVTHLLFETNPERVPSINLLPLLAGQPRSLV